jgi:hypothetical protein
MNGPNKLENYITLGKKGSLVIKHSSLFGTFVSYEKIKCCEYGSRLADYKAKFYSIESLCNMGRIDMTQNLFEAQ